MVSIGFTIYFKSVPKIVLKNIDSKFNVISLLDKVYALPTNLSVSLITYGNVNFLSFTFIEKLNLKLEYNVVLI